jgi:hypothetical protein
MMQIMDGMGENMRPWVTGSLPERDYRQKLVELFLEKFHYHRDSRGSPRKEKSGQADRSVSSIRRPLGV